MSGLIPTLAGAVLTAAVLTAALAVLSLLLRRRVPWRDLPAVGLITFFLALTQLPLPDRATMTCPVPFTDPDFWPGNSVLHVIGQVEAWGWKVAFFKDKTVIAAVMNFLVCAAIGLALAFQGRFGTRAILLFGALMTVSVELTQLTGTWGLFPCAYRKFDADDLVLNFLGVACGLALGRRRGWLRSPARPPGPASSRSAGP